MGQTISQINKFGRWIEKQNVIQGHSLEIISKAKVPLVKFVDKLTGLKVDISFENDTGLVANKTFQDWKRKYPSLPLLVTLVKHLLAMRGLNEPVNGGIGGFSVICLVVSLLQHMPQVASGTMVPEHHLGELLMEFLDLYGNRFNWLTTGIQFDPPRYVSKVSIRSDPFLTFANSRQANMGNIPYRNKNQARNPKICIIDPNRSDNDIAGGSSNTSMITQCFSDAYAVLQARMASVRDRPSESILACIFAGNYSSFKNMRNHLRTLNESLYPDF